MKSTAYMWWVVSTWSKHITLLRFPVRRTAVSPHLPLQTLVDIAPLITVPGGNSTKRMDLLAFRIVTTFLDRKWCDRFIMHAPVGSYFNPARDFGKSWGFLRRVELAELLFNLQLVPGYAGVIGRLREARSQDNLQGVIAELEVGRLLRRLNLQFSFVTPVGEKGKDYDFGIVIDNVHYCADSKCKLEGKALERSKIKETLKKARTQLPKEEEGMILVRVSFDLLGDLVESDRQIKELHAAATEFLRETDRVVGVIVFLHFMTTTKLEFFPKIMCMPIWTKKKPTTHLEKAFRFPADISYDDQWVSCQRIIQPLGGLMLASSASQTESVRLYRALKTLTSS